MRVTTTKKNYQTEALESLKEIASSKKKACEIVNNLVLNWSKTNYYFQYYGFPVIREEDVKSTDFSSFIKTTSKAYKDFLSEEKAEKLSEELFGYKIPFDKKNNKVADINGFNRSISKLFQFKVDAFYKIGVRDKLNKLISDSLGAPLDEEDRLVESIIKMTKSENSKDLFEKLSNLLLFRKNKSYQFKIVFYYNLMNHKVESFVPERTENGFFSKTSESLFCLKIETKPNFKVSPFLKVILSEDEEKIKKFLVKEVQKNASKLYLELSKRMLELKTTTYQFEESLRKIDFSEIKNLYNLLEDGDKEIARSILIKLALKD